MTDILLLLEQRQRARDHLEVLAKVAERARVAFVEAQARDACFPGTTLTVITAKANWTEACRERRQAERAFDVADNKVRHELAPVLQAAWHIRRDPTTDTLLTLVHAVLPYFGQTVDHRIAQILAMGDE